jgi:hypothetical protein
MCLILSSVPSSAQNNCKGKLFGIPVCTGFCLDNDSSWMKGIDFLGSALDSLHTKAMTFNDSLVKDKINELKKAADSIGRVVKRLKDSLNLEGGGNLGEVFKNFDFKGLTNDSFMKDRKFGPFEFPEFLNAPDSRFYENLPKHPFFKYPTPDSKEPKLIPQFKGWRMEPLAET